MAARWEPAVMRQAVRVVRKNHKAERRIRRHGRIAAAYKTSGTGGVRNRNRGPGRSSTCYGISMRTTFRDLHWSYPKKCEGHYSFALTRVKKKTLKNETQSHMMKSSPILAK